MWYRLAQFHDAYGKDLLDFGPFVMPKGADKNVAYTGVPQGMKGMMQNAQTQWSHVTWDANTGLQFWNAAGQLIGGQQPGHNIFTTLRFM